MGLRFRKSVTLCKGVRLNFGKSGTSITLGRRGFHKTISSNGRVTTTIGIPGTGIYYTDTKQIGKKQKSVKDKKTIVQQSIPKIEKPVDNLVNNPTQNISDVIDDWNKSSTISTRKQASYLDLELLYQNYREQHKKENISDISENVSSNVEIPWDYERYEKNKEVAYNIGMDALLWDDLITIHKPDIVMESKKEDMIETEAPVYFNAKMIKEIYTSCDQTILWEDIRLGAGAADLYMSQEIWDYCYPIAEKVIKKDVDTYLKVIDDLKPVDDLVLYGGEFEFGTDDGRYLEVEYKVFPDDVLEEGVNSGLLTDYIFAVSLRIARDLMATLPIDVIIIHAVIEEVTILSVAFERELLENIDFRNTQLIQITAQVPMRLSSAGEAVERIDYASYKSVPVIDLPKEVDVQNVNVKQKNVHRDEISNAHRIEEELIIRAWNYYGMNIFNENHMLELRREFEERNIEFREIAVLASLHAMAGYYWDDEVQEEDDVRPETSEIRETIREDYYYRPVGRIEHVQGHYRYRNGQREYVRPHYRRK